MSAILKQELINKISSSDDDELLLLLKADYDYFNHSENADVTDPLSQEDRNELITLANEPFGYETVSQSELDEAITKWRIK